MLVFLLDASARMLASGLWWVGKFPPFLEGVAASIVDRTIFD